MMKNPNNKSYPTKEEQRFRPKLFKQVRNGNQEAIDRLYKLYQARIITHP